MPRLRSGFESDRMLSLAFSDKALEVQRNVVMEEFKQVCLNQPYGDLGHHMSALAYKVHPYRTPVIGKELGHIESVTQEQVREFFRTHYAPNNAVLAVTGNITLDETRRLAEKWFGPIPRRIVAPRTYAPEPEQTEARRIVVTGNVPPDSCGHKLSDALMYQSGLSCMRYNYRFTGGRAHFALLP